MMSLAASGQSQDIDGKVRVTASEMTAAYLLPDILEHLSEVAPELHLEIAADNSIRDLLLREADIAVRHVRPDQPNLIAKLACTQTMRFYAVEGYGARHGLQNSPTTCPPSVRQLRRCRADHGLPQDGWPRLSQELSLRLELSARRMGDRAQRPRDRDLNDTIATKFPEFQPVLTEIEPFEIPSGSSPIGSCRPLGVSGWCSTPARALAGR